MGTNKRYPSREPQKWQPGADISPPTDWHPSRIAEPVEWYMRNGWPPDPIAVIRKLEILNGNLVNVVYRAVTWAPTSDGRELIGYYPTGDEAAAAAWEHRHRNHEFCQHGWPQNPS